MVKRRQIIAAASVGTLPLPPSAWKGAERSKEYRQMPMYCQRERQGDKEGRKVRHFAHRGFNPGRACASGAEPLPAWWASFLAEVQQRVLEGTGKVYRSALIKSQAR